MIDLIKQWTPDFPCQISKLYYIIARTNQQRKEIRWGHYRFRKLFSYSNLPFLHVRVGRESYEFAVVLTHFTTCIARMYDMQNALQLMYFSIWYMSTSKREIGISPMVSWKNKRSTVLEETHLRYPTRIINLPILPGCCGYRDLV